VLLYGSEVWGTSMVNKINKEERFLFNFLLLIGHVVTYIVLIKGGASERCDFSQFGKRQFSYGIYN
jgi:hypothetical protein